MRSLRGIIGYPAKKDPRSRAETSAGAGEREGRDEPIAKLIRRL